MQFLEVDDDAATVQIAEDIVILNNMWRTEANSPEILPYNERLVDAIREVLESQQVH